MGKVLWIFNHYAVTPDMPGITRHFDLAKELVKDGHDVTIFASGFEHQTKSYIKLSPQESKKIENYDGVRFVWINTIPYTKNDWRRVLNMISYGWRVLNSTGSIPRPDAIIGSSMHPFAAIAGWWLSKRYGVPFYFEERDLWPQTAIDMGVMKPNSLPAKLLFSWERFMYEKAERIIFVMPYGADYAIGRGVDPNKVFWLPNGVDLERFDNPDPLPQDAPVSDMFKKFSDCFKVIYTGSHGPSNGLEVIIEAAYMLKSSHPEVHFFLIGDGTEKAELMALVKKKDLKNISFSPPVSKNQIPTVLTEADVLVHVCRSLGALRYGISPNKLYDYMASGKPIITAIDAVNNPVKDANAGMVVEPENPKALAEAIVAILEMPPEERKQLGLNGRHYVEKYNSIKVLGKKLEQILGW